MSVSLLLLRIKKMSLQPRKAHNLLNELRVSCRSSENGGVWHVQEMTGRRPEGGEERTTAARSTYRNLQRDKEPVVFFTGFTFYRVSSHWSPMFLSGSCILGPGHSCPPSRLPPSLLPGPDTLPPPPPLFRRRLASLTVVTERFPICFRLPLAAVGSPPAIWARVASPLAHAAPDGTEGGMEGRQRGEHRGFTFS